MNKRNKKDKKVKNYENIKEKAKSKIVGRIIKIYLK